MRTRRAAPGIPMTSNANPHANPHVTQHDSRAWRYSRPVLLGALATLVILLIMRIAATYVLQWYVNNKLDESPDYAGQVGDIDISLLAGAYSIENVEIEKTEGDVPVPLFAAREVRFSVLWSGLLNGAVVGEAEMFEPQINIVDSEDETKKQTGAGGQWLSMFDDLFPLTIDRAVIHDGQLHFRNFDAEPQMDIFLSEVELEAVNLSNSQATTDSRIARVQLAARAMESSDLTVGAAFDPTTEKPTFDVNAKLLTLPILELDNFIKTYAPFDIEAGTVDVVSELAARDGMLVGYVKPIIYDLEVFTWKDDIGDDGDNPLSALWEGLVEVVAELLENQPRDQIASNIPLEGDISAPDTNMFVAVANIFKNAFVEAYEANLENTISLLLPGEDEELASVSLPAPLGEDELVDDPDVERREEATIGTPAEQNDAEAAARENANAELAAAPGERDVDETSAAGDDARRAEGEAAQNEAAPNDDAPNDNNEQADSPADDEAVDEETADEDADKEGRADAESEAEAEER